MKKWFVALLILALLPAFGAGAEAVGDFTVRYMEDGTASIVSYNGTDASVKIPSYFNSGNAMHPLTAIGAQAFMGNTTLTEVEIPDGVATIEPRAFSGCVNLQKVTLPGNVTGIGEGAFENCASLTEINLPAKLYYAGANIFAGCSRLVLTEAQLAVLTSTESGENTEQAANVAAAPTGDHTDLQDRLGQSFQEVAAALNCTTDDQVTNGIQYSSDVLTVNSDDGARVSSISINAASGYSLMGVYVGSSASDAGSVFVENGMTLVDSWDRGATYSDGENLNITYWKDANNLVIGLNAALPVDETQYAKGKAIKNVNIRTAAGKNHTIILSAPAGKTVDYLGESQRDNEGTLWYHVRYNNKTGWASADYITLMNENGSFDEAFQLLKRGSKSEAVTTLQKRLIELKYLKGTADGSFGPATETAVMLFQQASGMNPSGIADEETLKAIYSDSAVVKPGEVAGNTLEIGSKGDGVKAIQDALKAKGYLTGASDGNFGSATASALKGVQRANGLPVTGVADDATRAALLDENSVAMTETTATTASLYETLKKGDQGTSVKTLQEKLKALGYLTGAADGKYGAGTETAVKSFQKAAGLTETGTADPETLSAVYAAKIPVVLFKRGAKGDDVSALQQKLKALGYLTGAADGRYGAGTVKAVEAFQKDNGLEATGRVDEDTMAALNAKEIPARTSFARGDIGDDVKALQERLKALGYLEGEADGNFGSKTEQAIRKFQQAKSIKVTGKADEETVKQIMGGEPAAAQPEQPAENAGAEPQTQPEQPAENTGAEPQTQPEQPAENAGVSAAAQNLLCGKLAYTLPEGWYLVNKNTAATLAAQPDAAAVFAAAQGADFFQKCAQMETDEIYNAEGYMVMQVKNTGRMGQDQAVLDSAKDVFGESVRKEMQNNGYDKNYEYALETVGDITFFVSFASRETDGKTEYISHCVTIDAATDAIEIITYADKETTLNLLKGFATAV